MARRAKPPKPRPRIESHADAVQRGIAMQRQGRVDEAAAVYRRVLASAPHHVDALHFLGVAEHQSGRREEGLALITRARDLAPKHPDIHVNRGNVLKLLGRIDEAEEAFLSALAIDPDNANALNNMGTVLRERGDLDEATELFRKAVATEPEHADAYQNLGSTLLRMGMYDEGLDAQQQALRLRPRSGALYRQIGATLQARGRAAEAADVYRRWLELEPDDPEGKHLLAACTGSEAPDRASDACVRNLFDRFAPSFDKALARLGYRAPALVAEAVAAVCDAASPIDVLDAGCGTGLCGESLRPYARRLVGVDLSAKMIERARDRGVYDDLVEAELTAYLEARPAAYDLVVSADTLVYFGALEAVAAAAASALRPAGRLVFTVEHAEGAGALGHRLQPHGRYAHSEGYVRGVLGAAGLAVAAVRHVVLRKEAGKDVAGLLVTAARP